MASLSFRSYNFQQPKLKNTDFSCLFSVSYETSKYFQTPFPYFLLSLIFEVSTYKGKYYERSKNLPISIFFSPKHR